MTGFAHDPSVQLAAMPEPSTATQSVVLTHDTASRELVFTYSGFDHELLSRWTAFPDLSTATHMLAAAQETPLRLPKDPIS
jgi:hypothetical protein